METARTDSVGQTVTLDAAKFKKRRTRKGNRTNGELIETLDRESLINVDSAGQLNYN